MTKNDKDCLNLLKKEVDATVKGLEEAAHGDYENFADYLDDNLGVEIRIDAIFTISVPKLPLQSADPAFGSIRQIVRFTANGEPIWNFQRWLIWKPATR